MRAFLTKIIHLDTRANIKNIKHESPKEIVKSMGINIAGGLAIPSIKRKRGKKEKYVRFISHRMVTST